MGLIQFSLFAPILIGVFATSVNSLKGRECRSKAIKKIVVRELENSIDEIKIKQPLNLDFQCRFLISKKDHTYKVHFLERLKKMQMSFSIPGGVDNEK